MTPAPFTPECFSLHKFRRIALFTLCLVSFFGVTRLYDDFGNAAYCTLCYPFQEKDTGRSRFLSSSNVEQILDAQNTRNYTDNEESSAAWNIFSPAVPGTPGILRITVKKDRDVFVFFPRLEGAESSVTVYAEDDPYQRRLFTLRGKDGQWTEMGRQYVLDLRCAPYGWSRKDVDVKLVIIMTGKWSQIWHLGSAVLF